ncbi:sister chromatid cohesion 1 protein 3-like isoform X2 [Phragmites australis]|nr:sister chromatid cohesion 1 protein 3-like isoform X2 [Phragmites australis]
MFPEVPIALRLSGHLLLGLVRIYSWKVNYLFQDCNRMVTTIRTAFASVQVDLPFESDRVRFEAITLPPTFNLDDLDLDDAICQMNTPDSHRKAPDEITLGDGEYVMIDLDEDVRVESSAPGLSSLMGPKPIENEMFPPFDDGFGENDNHNDEIPPPGNLPVNSNTKNQTDGAQDPPEKMREASQEGPGLNLTDLIIGNDDPMEVNQGSSPFVQNKVISPPVIDEISSADQQIPGRSIPNLRTPTIYDPFDDDNQLPEWRMNPSLPQVQPSPPQARNRRPKAPDNKRKRKRRVKFDEEIVLSNNYMKGQISGAVDELKRKRRKLPQTALNMWRFSRTNRSDSFFLEPLLHGMCSNLHATYGRNFPRVSDPDPKSAAGEPTAGEANGSGQDPPPERQLTAKPHGNEDALPERHITSSPKPQGNADANPEPLPTLKSPEADAAPDEDMLPELPRFSPVDMPSPIGRDDSAFKTPGTRTPQSGLGGTGVTEIPPSDGSYLLPGQNTRDSDMESLFPINEDDYDQPDIPGLISTPGVISSAGTGVTGLGSMSARTRVVAQFFKYHMPSTSSDEQPGKFSLDRILEGRTRKQAARMFFETTVLKSYDYIDARQEEAYGDIEISVKPSLSADKL